MLVNKLSCLACKLKAPFYPGHHRFVPMMPTPSLFIVFSFLLRILEGVGTAMYSTVSYTLLSQFYPENKGTVVVSAILPELLHFSTQYTATIVQSLPCRVCCSLLLLQDMQQDLQ